MKDEILLRVNRRDAHRILSNVKDRRNKFQKGVNKFQGHFDMERGKNMVEGLAAYNDLIQRIEAQL